MDRPNTKVFPDADRERLGRAVKRAREAMGMTIAQLCAATQLGRTSLIKLENGRQVGGRVYEAVARSLPNWTEDTPMRILQGEPPPEPPAPRSAAVAPPVSAVITASPDDPEFWVALRDEVPREKYDSLWELYLQQKRTRSTPGGQA